MAGVTFEHNLEIPDIAGQSGWTVLAVAGACLLLPVLVALVGIGVLLKRRFDRSLAGYKQKKTQYDSEDLPRWERAMQRWNQLYYCMRDETVFLPGEEKIIQLDDLEKYLIDPYFRSS